MDCTLANSSALILQIILLKHNWKDRALDHQVELINMQSVRCMDIDSLLLHIKIKIFSEIRQQAFGIL